MAEIDFKSGYVGSYWKLLDELKVVRATNPSAYNDVAEVVSHMRDWVKAMAHVDDLPEVPKP